MKRIETTDFTCDGCKQTGKIATSILKADRPVKVKHSLNAGGCGYPTIVGKKK
ncbi:hypothetical protein ACIBQ1_10245 [Nonomuraea sp. NPDC050153]|uniref:hypothetical protein n=1 Tax=Nonomuraea sp. NPDC050153 TaxID=3364359 RepID=UPI00379395EB